MTAIHTASKKFQDPRTTADGSERAWVHPTRLETLWLNSGTLCNLSCANCYIESTPKNDALVYLTREEAHGFLVEAKELGTREIGITGGEPFLNPSLMGIIEDGLELGFEVLVLTNATKPMQRPRIQEALLALPNEQRSRLTLRVSLDHHTSEIHERERGAGTFESALTGLRWLQSNGFTIAVAGRRELVEDEASARQGYGALFSSAGIDLDITDPKKLVLFAEMRAKDDPPEITTACWGILGKSPEQIMCSNSRMVVKRKGAEAPVVLSCTLLAYDERFEMGATLKDSLKPVSLNHPWCATFCVLGGSSCS
ncbi:MAG: radical SAM protein [Myxococcota bacterium]